MQHWARLPRGSRRPAPRRRRSWTARAAEHDLTARSVVTIAILVGASTAWLEIATTGRLGWFFDVMFVLVSVTNALAASRDALYAAMVTPPVVLLAVLIVVAVIRPGAVDEPGSPPDASVVQLVAIAIIHHALAWAIALGAVLGITAWRRTAVRG